MLKIKKNVDLSILETKYGFRKGYNLFDNDYEVEINKDRHIIYGLQHSVWYNTDFYYHTNADVLFDLIEDGIVEKE